jgi:hypothetical protein
LFAGELTQIGRGHFISRFVITRVSKHVSGWMKCCLPINSSSLESGGSLSFPRERLHFRDGLPHLGRVCARVGSSEADFMLIFQLEMLPLLRETRYDWSYDSGSGTRPVLKRDSFRALYESFKCGVSSRLFA